MPRNDGGSAFPWGGELVGGMALRDYFAGQIAAAKADSIPLGPPDTYRLVAKIAYRLADALIAARDSVE